MKLLISESEFGKAVLAIKHLNSEAENFLPPQTLPFIRQGVELMRQSKTKVFDEFLEVEMEDGVGTTTDWKPSELIEILLHEINL